ncbi:MAG: protein-L-isoaspartate O-methyltransferase [Candidatus Diapherotrites archaeon]|nr:protein-L-isoaspartate O-methyltransferase [Candidatus Diapherotrites archaeon]
MAAIGSEKVKEEFFGQKRSELAQFMKSTGAIKTREVENAFLNVKREIFAPKHLQKEAYDDNALPIGFGQTISQPSTIALMLEMLAAKSGQKVLEVGSGCGYVLALLGELVGIKGKVFGIEAVKELAEISKKNLKSQGCKNAKVFQGDGSIGLKKYAPFDRILVSAACPFFPKSLFDQLKEGGIGVAPVGDKGTQMLQAVAKKNGNPLKSDYIEHYFVFVPLLGKEGFRNELL